MTIQRLSISLSGLNLLLILILVAHMWPAIAAPPSVLRGSGLEIVDDHGRVRASISIQPPVTAPDGDAYTETILLRLIDPNGQPSVRISTSVTGAGLSLVGGDDESYVILAAEGPETRLKMVEPGGREQLFTPD